MTRKPLLRKVRPTMRAIYRTFVLLSLSSIAIAASSTARAQSTSASLPNAPSATAVDAGPCIVEPTQARTPVTARIRVDCLVNTTFSVGALLVPAFAAGFRMAHPLDNYPREWKDGAGAFGRNYGDQAARNTAGGLAQFAVAAIDREDPRYYASSSPRFAPRVIHALKFTIFDKSQSGHTTLAVSNFASAAAGGFVGMAYLPNGYDDVTHAYQHTAVEFGVLGGQYILYEFYPEIARFAHKLHIPIPKP